MDQPQYLLVYLDEWASAINMGKIKSVAMASSSLVDGSVSYLSNPKKLCTEKLYNNVLKPYWALFMRLDTTKFHLEHKSNGHSRS